MIWFVLGVAAMAIAATLASWEGRLSWGVLYWFIASLISELLWIRLPVGQATVSMASCAHFAALLSLPSGQAMALVAVSGAVAEAWVLRKPAQRVLFNSSQSALAVGAASWVVAPGAAIGGAPLGALASVHPVTLLFAAVTYFAINSGAVSMAVGLAERTSPLTAWKRNFGNRHELFANTLLFSFGVLLASGHARYGPVSLLLAIVPTSLAYLAYRARSRSPVVP